MGTRGTRDLDWRAPRSIMIEFSHSTALIKEVAELLDDAAERAEANDRKTVQPRDL